MKRILVAALLASLVSNPLMAEDLKTILDKVSALASKGEYQNALNELAWAKKELEKLSSDQLVKLLPDELVGFKGGKVESNSALGITNIERKYSKNDSTVNLSITGTGSAGGLGGLAAFGQMAAMMGAQSGQDVFRIKGLTAQLEGDRLQIFLSSGSILSLELTSGSENQLKAMAEALDLTKIDNHLKGVS
jgi:hypothetical protein